ncbi:MAG: VapE family protein [Edaphocola sp.]
MTSISLYGNIKQVANGALTSLDYFLADIKGGRWINEVIAYRNNEPIDFPNATISGEFGHRSVKGLVRHSGFICMDIDDVDPEVAKSALRGDKFLYAAFASRGGRGLACIFKISPKKHAEAFDGLSQYLYERYGLVADPSCRDVSRTRFVSYDPDLYLYEGAEKFDLYPKAPPPALKKLPQTVFVQSDFDEVVAQITDRRLDLTAAYQDWLHIGFALADRFGEGGRHYFHLVSQFNPKYSANNADRQYTNCLKAGGSGRTIATFYWFCKEAGIETMSRATKLVAKAASQARKGGRTKEDTVRLLAEAEGIAPEVSSPVVEQVFGNNISVDTGGDTLVEDVEAWLRQNYVFGRNMVTRRIYCNGQAMETRDFNSVYVKCRKEIEKVDFQTVDRIINSDFVGDFDPFAVFLEKCRGRRPKGLVQKMADSIMSDTGDRDFRTHFVTKWLLGIVQTMLGRHSPLVLVLSGSRQNTGKTEWFRRLLPQELKPYYAESRLDAGKDDEILLCQKLVVMDDEFGGKSKADSRRLKELTSKDIFSLREPYGRHNVDMRRLAVLCGTTNETGLLADPTGNRRLIPLNVLGIDHDLYNGVDKAGLFAELLHLYEIGHDANLDAEEISVLNEGTGDFGAVSAERELIGKYFVPGGKYDEFLTNTDIKAKLELWSGQRLDGRKIGMELKNMGFERVSRRVSGVAVYGYYIKQAVPV